MTDRELMQQALDALNELLGWQSLAPHEDQENAKAIALQISARLAQPEQEPVAWVAYENGEKHGIDFDEDKIAELPIGTMLYTAPPQREWQGLTHEEHMEIMTGTMTTSSRMAAVEAKLKEKNT